MKKILFAPTLKNEITIKWKSKDSNDFISNEIGI